MQQEKLITNRELLNNLINVIKLKDVEPISIINIESIESGFHVDYLNGDLESKEDIISYNELFLVQIKKFGNSLICLNTLLLCLLYTQFLLLVIVFYLK